MILLRAEYAKMCTTAERLRELCSGLKKHLESLEKSVGRLELTWDGDANAAFMLQMQEDFIKLHLLRESAEVMTGLLLSAIEEYQKTELVIEQKIGGIKV